MRHFQKGKASGVLGSAREFQQFIEFMNDKCLRYVFPVVMKWSEYEYNHKRATIENDVSVDSHFYENGRSHLIQTRNGVAGIKDLCDIRCQDPNFGGVTNGPMSNMQSKDPLEIKVFGSAKQNA